MLTLVLAVLEQRPVLRRCGMMVDNYLVILHLCLLFQVLELFVLMKMLLIQ